MWIFNYSYYRYWISWDLGCRFSDSRGKTKSDQQDRQDRHLLIGSGCKLNPQYYDRVYGAVDRFHKVVPAPHILFKMGDHHHHQLFCSWRTLHRCRIVLHTYATMYSTSMC